MKRMRRCLAIATVLAGCLHHRGVAVDNAVLGRVVIYRNGVAFYEKHATVEDGRLAVHVPRERVDDFLKSLTVVDPSTRRPLAVTIPRTQGSDGYLTMTLDAGEARRSDVLLTYVTEAAACSGAVPRSCISRRKSTPEASANPTSSTEMAPLS